MTANNSSSPCREIAVLGGGCFWCLEAVFDDLAGVESVESGYAGGPSASPTYDEVCSGRTGHAEVVRVTFDPSILSYRDLLNVFFAIHDPTTKDRQGNDVGTQYRSAIFTTTDAQLAAAEDSRDRYQAALTGAGYKSITTQIAPAKDAGDGIFYYAEDYHQGYLHKHPGGYCNHGFCQIGYDLAAHGQGVARAVLPES